MKSSSPTLEELLLVTTYLDFAVVLVSEAVCVVYEALDFSVRGLLVSLVKFSSEEKLGNGSVILPVLKVLEIIKKFLVLDAKGVELSAFSFLKKVLLIFPTSVVEGRGPVFVKILEISFLV